MPVEPTRVRFNFLAILAAAAACFLLEGVWYTLFQQAWLQGIGRSREFLMSLGVNPGLQYGTAFLAAALSAAAISGATQLTGAQTARRGAKVGAFLWFGVVMPTWATEYVFEVRSYALFALNTGVWLLGMVLMGVIVGAWKRK
jgi:uncharacterized protein DUF1761